MDLNVYEIITLIIIGIVGGLSIGWIFSKILFNPKRRLERKAVNKIMKQKDWEFYNDGEKIDLKDQVINAMGHKEVKVKDDLERHKNTLRNLKELKKKNLEKKIIKESKKKKGVKRK